MIRTAGLVAACLPATASAQGFLTPIGPIAEAQRTELVWASVMIFVAIAPVLIGVPWILWRYRRSNTNAKYRPQWHFDTKLEILMWAGPTLIIIALSVWLTQAVFRLDPYRDIDAEMADGFDFEITGDTVSMDIIGLDWKWLFIYPDEGIATLGEMVVPVGHPVSMRLTTDTVMQSFMATGLAGQIYTMAGMVTRMNLIADRMGETLIENTQYNGPGFPSQRAPVRAVPEEEFARWRAEARRNALTLDAQTYAILAKSGDLSQVRSDLGLEGSGPIYFEIADSGLFDRIVGRYHTGAPIPAVAQPGSPSYDPEQALLPSLAEIFPGAFCGPGATRLASSMPLPEN